MTRDEVVGANPRDPCPYPCGTASHSVKVNYHRGQKLSRKEQLDEAIISNSFEVLTRDETETLIGKFKVEVYEKLRAMEKRLNDVSQGASNAEAKPSEAPTQSAQQTPIKELSDKEKSQMVTQNLDQELESLKKQIQSRIDEIKRSTPAHSPSP